MQKLELYYFNECPYCQLVLKAIKDVSWESKIIFLNTREDKSQKEQLQKLTGKTQVPCLVIDGKPMFESKDIAQWIKEKAAKA